MTKQRPSLAHSLGQFTGHLLGAIRGKPNTTAHLKPDAAATEQRKLPDGTVTLRRTTTNSTTNTTTTVEEVEFRPDSGGTTQDPRQH